jgi:predicted transposase YdaD
MQILDLKKMDITQSRFYQEIRTDGRQEEASRGASQFGTEHLYSEE